MKRNLMQFLNRLWATVGARLAAPSPAFCAPSFRTGRGKQRPYRRSNNYPCGEALIHSFARRAATAFLTPLLLVLALSAGAHPPQNTNLPPTKATGDLQTARRLMDAAKTKLTQAGKYACCIKAPEGAKAAGCDLCARVNGSCNCAVNLAAGKGVCGDCLSGWKTGRGAIPGVKPDSVKMLHSGEQKMTPTDMPALPELIQAREAMNTAKRTLVKEGRFACCVGKGGCDECAYEKNCPCGQEAAEGKKGGGICGQCYDGWQAGIGRLAGLTAQDMKMQPMQDMQIDAHGKPGQMAGMTGDMHGMMAMMTPLAGVAMQQEASGTSWMPAASPMYGAMRKSGRWNLMTHYNAFLAYDRQDGPRGDYQYNSMNWAMLMAERPVKNDRLMLRVMLSLEPLTATPGGYPLLYQSGEQYHGKPLVDRQHPHDLFMEVAVKYTHPLGRDSAIFAYAAPAGEPALGPTAFMHRLSGLDNPIAPITHHWQDSTHIEFGVLTLGGWKRNVQLEASYFTGREPNEFRYDFTPFHPDSFSGRLTWNPGRNWSLQTSYGYLHSPEQLRPDEDTRRTTASAQYTLPLRRGGFWATTMGYGGNNTSGVNSPSFLLESELNLGERNTVFGRFETVDKLGEELDLPPASHKFGLSQFTLGYVRDFTPNRPYQTGVGAAVTFDAHPSELDSTYGKSPMGFWLFFRIRPKATQHGG